MMNNGYDETSGQVLYDENMVELEYFCPNCNSNLSSSMLAKNMGRCPNCNAPKSKLEEVEVSFDYDIPDDEEYE